MTPADVVVLSILALLTAGVIFSMRRKKKGGCCAGCSGCAGCPSRGACGQEETREE